MSAIENAPARAGQGRINLRNFQVFFFALIVSAVVVAAKAGVHALGWELVTFGSLHTSAIAGTVFVLGFLLSTTISDYKESEKIPAEFAAAIENMYEDAASIRVVYPNFNLELFRSGLEGIAISFDRDIRGGSHLAQRQIHRLNASFVEMEQAGVPANFIVKLKTQQAQLVRHVMRVTYIQTIRFVPSATILGRSIVILAIAMLLLTAEDDLFSGLLLTGFICFIQVFILRLIHVISTPFHLAGVTQDDVSLFLISQAVDHLREARTTE